MRVVLCVLAVLLAPSVLASSTFAEREGTLELSCGSFYAGAFGLYYGGYECHKAERFATSEDAGRYVANFTWVPETDKPVVVTACVSAARLVASAAGHVVTTSAGQVCTEGRDGFLSVAMPASPDHVQVSVSIQLRPGAVHSVGFYCCPEASVDYVLRHEP